MLGYLKRFASNVTNAILNTSMRDNVKPSLPLSAPPAREDYENGSDTIDIEEYLMYDTKLTDKLRNP